MEEQRAVRLQKNEALAEAGIPTRPDRFHRTHLSREALDLPEGTEGVAVSGRLMLVRHMGKLAFGHLQDTTGRIQIMFRKNLLGEDAFKILKSFVDLGDFLGVRGKMIVTRTGEVTVEAAEVVFLGKSLRPLPEKWHGVQDLELCYRQRYLDLLMNPETRERFELRARVVREIRRMLDDHGFTEVDTPILVSKPSGALARPFVTHHNALDIDLYLRIAPETYLKRLIVGGLERVYEFARCFRNEGVDPSHLQEFTMLEYYAAYWSYEENMDFTEALLKELLTRVYGSLETAAEKTGIDWSGDWPRLDMSELIERDSGIRIEDHPDVGSLRGAMKEHSIELEVEGLEKLGRGSLIDQLYKKVCRPGIEDPMFLVRHPIDLSPLARRSDEDPGVADRFQLVVKGWEIVNAYSELVDPVEQAERLASQARLRAGGDHEAMEMDEDYVLAMEYGMPPISGWGMGIDRIVALFTGRSNLRDVVFFPTLR